MSKRDFELFIETADGRVNKRTYADRAAAERGLYSIMLKQIVLYDDEDRIIAYYRPSESCVERYRHALENRY